MPTRLEAIDAVFEKQNELFAAQATAADARVLATAALALPRHHYYQYELGKGDRYIPQDFVTPNGLPVPEQLHGRLAVAKTVMHGELICPGHAAGMVACMLFKPFGVQEGALRSIHPAPRIILDRNAFKDDSRLTAIHKANIPALIKDRSIVEPRDFPKGSY